MFSLEKWFLAKYSGRNKHENRKTKINHNNEYKKGIISSLEQTYIYLGMFDDVNDDIEKVWVKRKLAKYFDEISALVKETNNDTWKQQFDRFLDIIFEMQINTKEFYIALANKPIRAEEDIQKARDAFSELKISHDSIVAELEKIKKGSLKSENFLMELEVLKTNITTFNEEANKIISHLTSIEENANVSKKTIEDISPKISSTYTEIKELQKTLVSDAEKINTMSALCEKNVEKIKSREDSLQKQINLDNEIQKGIQQTLEDVNRHGMAGAFLR